MFCSDQHNINRLKLWILMIGLAAFWAVPIINAVQMSLSRSGFDNYKIVLTFRVGGILYLPRMFVNSVIISGSSIVLIMSLSILAAYAFSKMRFLGRNTLYVLALSFYTVPVLATLFPNVMLLRAFGLRGTYFAMILPMVAINLPLSLIIFRNYFDGIPDSILEASRIDGASHFRNLTTILIPISGPIMINAFIVLFLLTWNDYVIPLMFAARKEFHPLTLAPGFFSLTKDRIEYGPLYASIILIAVPSLLIYAILQNRLINGIMAGSIKE